MAAEIRVDRITSRTGINTLSFTESGISYNFNVGFGTTSPRSRVDVEGDIRVSGVITATSFSGSGANLTGIVVGAGGTWQANNVGIFTSKIVGVNTTNITGTAKSEGALQSFGNVAVIDGVLLTDQTIDGEVTIPSGRNGLLIGPVTISTGSTVTVQTGSTLVIV